MFGPYLDFFDSSFDSLYWLELFSWSGPFNINSGVAVGVIALHTCAFVPSVVSLPCVPYGTRLIKMESRLLCVVDFPCVGCALWRHFT